MSKSPASLGARFVPRRWHERLQVDRFPICDFVRRELLPCLGDGRKILDAGSGRLPEQYLRAEIMATGAQLTTLDLFAGEGVDVAGDVADLPFPAESFEAVLCTQVLEHVQDPQAVCRELYRVLKPGGVAVVTAPQSAWLHNLPYHYFHFTRIGLAQMLERSGFKVEKIEPQGGHFIILALHLHYTARVLHNHFQGRRVARWLVWPVVFVWRLLFGFLFKGLAIGLDRLIPHEGNTQGWNVLATRPANRHQAAEK